MSSSIELVRRSRPTKILRRLPDYQTGEAGEVTNRSLAETHTPPTPCSASVTTQRLVSIFRIQQRINRQVCIGFGFSGVAVTMNARLASTQLPSDLVP